jgi:hypothetical protein
MIRYRHTQTGYVSIAAVGAALAIVGIQARILGTLKVFAGISVPLIGVGVIFSRQTIEITGSVLRSYFGFGWPSKEVRLDQIESAVPVRNSWWYGWGIRWTPHGWLYNVSGLDAVEIVLRDGKRFRLGTDEPGRLAAAIMEAKGKV